MSSTSDFAQPDAAASTRLYRAVWRWHFYAGLFVVPFIIMLALTGLFMMVYSDLSNELGWAPNVQVSDKALPVSAQAKAALAEVPGGVLATYIAPRAPNRPAYFELNKDGSYVSVAVNPHDGTVLATTDESATWRAFAEKLHGTLQIGWLGDRLIEAAASLGVIMAVTGYVLWWPRGKSLRHALLPDMSRSGRGWWKELHAAAGAWIGLFLIGFLVSGLAWAGIWGDSYVKPWSSFPASKWDNVPLSDTTHASMNHDLFHEVPWTLEATPLPESGSSAGASAVAQPVAIDSVVQWAAANGFHGQYKLSVPADDKGVFTVALDGRNQDSANPSEDRYVHIDRYTGNVLADVRFSDYPVVGKIMAWGIALHKGMVGRANFVFNLAYLSLLLFLCISGIVMWWKRRPVGALGAPLYPRDYRLNVGVAVLAVALGLIFPMGGAAILAFAIVDFLLPKRLKEAGFQTQTQAN